MSGDSQRVIIVSGVRTPIASFKGSFSGVSPAELGSIAAREAIKRSGLSPDDIEESFVGAVLTANCGQNVARQVAVAAGSCCCLQSTSEPLQVSPRHPKQ